MNKSKLQRYIELAREGTKQSIKKIMLDLNENITLMESRFIDYALGHIESDEGVKAMEYYLFNGSQIQRNYCTLYFNRREDYPIVVQAWKEGLIDDIQAFSR